MVVRYAENSIAAHYDQEAVHFIEEAVKWEKQADAAASPESQKKYRKKAQALRKKAIEALENAKVASWQGHKTPSFKP